MWRIPFRDGAFPHTVDSLSSGSILHAAGISPSGGSISHAAGISPSSGNISHAAHSLPAGAFRMRQLRGGEAFIVAKAIFPPRAPPLRPRSFVVRCGDVCMYWWGDGCCGIGYKTLCRFIPILHNFLQSITYSPQTTRKLSLSSTPSSAALTAHPTPGKPLSLTL